MKIVTSKKKFDDLMRDVNIELIELKQSESGVEFDSCGVEENYHIDFVGFYNFFDERIHGKDRIIWELEK